MASKEHLASQCCYLEHEYRGDYINGNAQQTGFAGGLFSQMNGTNRDGQLRTTALIDQANILPVGGHGETPIPVSVLSVLVAAFYFNSTGEVYQHQEPSYGHKDNACAKV